MQYTFCVIGLEFKKIDQSYESILYLLYNQFDSTKFDLYKNFPVELVYLGAIYMKKDAKLDSNCNFNLDIRINGKRYIHGSLRWNKKESEFYVGHSFVRMLFAR